MLGVLALGLASVVLLVGCGGGDGDDELSAGAADPDLVGLVAPAKPHVRYVDVAGARAQLGLAPDEELDLAANTEAPSSEQLILSNVAYALLVFAPDPRPGPIADAIDGARVSAGASPNLVSADTVAAVRTGQPFAELASTLERYGYRRRGDLVASDSADVPGPFFPAVADGGDGVIILAGSAEAADRAPNDRGVADGDAASLLDEVGGVVRRVDVRKPQRGCVVSIAIGADLDPALGEIVVTVAGEASEEAFVLDDTPPQGVEFQEVDVEGSVVRADFTYRRDGSLAVGPTSVEFADREIYRC
jgi:hypothetical protein